MLTVSGLLLACVGCAVRRLHVCGCDRATMVSDAIVNYFLVDLDIERHFVALHRYLLLQDGEYTQSLTDQLFNKVRFAPFDTEHVH